MKLIAIKLLGVLILVFKLSGSNLHKLQVRLLRNRFLDLSKLQTKKLTKAHKQATSESKSYEKAKK